MDNDKVAPEFSPEAYPLLNGVQARGGIKHLSIAQLETLASELRQSLVEIVQHTGGHLASNLGVVELSIAMHYVFDSPRDAFLWDVGHQAYVHKMLTGRWRDFATLRQRAGLYGFPRRAESPHDYLNAGHAGTAISVGLGLDLGRQLHSHRPMSSANQGSEQALQKNAEAASEHKVFCVVGDAALSSGLAFEAMNHCGHQPNRLVVILNDNEMSISPNVGAISRVLSRLTSGYSYVFIRDHINEFIRRIPLLGMGAYKILLRLKGAIKKAVYRTNLFTEFGFKYVGPIDGHDIGMLIDTFQRIYRLNEPLLLHISTQKGKGLKEAEEAPAKYHGLTPSKKPNEASDSKKDSQLGERNSVEAQVLEKSFTQSFTASLMDLEANYENLVCISAAMTGSTGLQPFADLHPERFFDVGIAEQHALSLGCGLAMTGQVLLIAIYSTFMQRAMDQLIHDVSLMHLPIIFVCDRAGIVPGDGDTHQGIYDIAQFRSIIGLELYSPATQEQLQACLQQALESAQNAVREWQDSGRQEFNAKPMLIRLPKRNCPAGSVLGAASIAETGETGEAQSSYSYFPAEKQDQDQNKNQATLGRRLLLICTGSLLPEALAVQEHFSKHGAERSQESIDLDVLQLCRLSPLPVLPAHLQAACSLDTAEPYSAIYCIEDGVVQGGVGQAIAQLQAAQPIASLRTPVFLRGVGPEVPQLGTYNELLCDFGLDPKGLQYWILETLETLETPINSEASSQMGNGNG